MTKQRILIAVVAGYVLQIFCLSTPASAGIAIDDVRVMTRNIYVGADIFRVVEAPDAIALAAEIIAVYETVQQTNFPERAEALADEILVNAPHLIGLQEVSLIRIQNPGDFLFGNPLPATDVDQDFLQLLLDALSTRGLSYVVAAVVENADVELPLFGAEIRDVRLTDRDVILARSDVVIDNVLEKNFDEFVTLDLSGVSVEFKRGFTAVDAQVGARAFRFVNTHLEVGGAFGAATQALQVPELIAAFADDYRPVIIVGDFNSSPNDPPTQPYAQLGAAGYVDIWPLHDAIDPGLTCCHSETLDDPGSVLTSRIDHIFIRNATTPATIVVDAEVLGDQLGDMTPSGLWPSDHAGVFAALAVPAADTDADGFDDLNDNCILAANSDQRDTDQDGFGNVCDADFNQDNIVNFPDLAYMSVQFLGTDPDADLDGSGMVNLADVAIMRALFFAPPGPAANVTAALR